MMKLSQLANIVRGKRYGEDALINEFQIDSRAINANDLFVAINSKRDGHEFLSHALKRGACGALVTKKSDANIAQIVVSDTTKALGEAAAYWRNLFDIPIIAVTGSNGKTTVCNMIAHILNDNDNCLSPQNSFNNQWGVPLTLLKLRKKHTHAVIEMGMNHRGEMAYLSKLTKPTLALINNIGNAHLGNFDNLAEIAHEKSEIATGLNGVLFLNGDDFFYQYISKQKANYQQVTFGISNPHNFSYSDPFFLKSSSSARFYQDNKEQIEISLNIGGKHQLFNALSAYAVCRYLGYHPQKIADRLKSFTTTKGRLFPYMAPNNVQIIDDTYNANPDSMRAAIDYLAKYKNHQRVLILSPMVEIGDKSKKLHFEVGQYAKNKGVQKLYVLDEAKGFGEDISQGYGAESQLFNEKNDIVNAALELANQPTVFLIKGSRYFEMERVLNDMLSRLGVVTC